VQPSGVITITTDFGHKGPFTAVMKGVILTRFRNATVIDLAEKTFDAAILDIMGVNGYDLLELCRQKQIPAVMLTAHALSPDHLVMSVEKGAYAYIPKDEMIHIDNYLSDVIASRVDSALKPVDWWKRLAPVFDKKFGPNWKVKHREFLKEFNLDHTREELEGLL